MPAPSDENVALPVDDMVVYVNVSVSIAKLSAKSQLVSAGQLVDETVTEPDVVAPAAQV